MTYLFRKDYQRMKQLVMRGAEINYVNSFTKLTPIHYAIDNDMEPEMIKFLIELGANPHAEDKNGVDICDKVFNKKKYKDIK